MNRECDTSEREARLAEVLLAYVEACEAGRRPDQAKILDAHPDLQVDLALYFRERDRLEGLGAFVRHGEVSGTGTTSGPPLLAAPEAIEGQLGDFRLRCEIGRGGMGTVYEAEQISLRRRVALKVLPFASALDPRQLQRFQNEAWAAAHLRHEHIVAVHAVGCERGVHYYAMQFVEGQSLAAILAERRRPPEPNPEATTVALGQHTTEKQAGGLSYFEWIAGLGKQAALALEHAHQTGVVHRDIKPGNLLLDTRGHLWVTDFGLAQVASNAGLTMTGEMLGTLRYASPEQLLGRRGVVDHRSDIYSLGATLFELLTLRPPFDGQDRHELLQQIADDDPPTLRSLTPEIPVDLETIVLKTLRKDPSERYATAQDLADDLGRFLDRQPIVARPPGFSERCWGWARRHPTSLVTSLLALLFLTLCSLVVAILVGVERERTRAAQGRAEMAFLAERERAEEAVSRLMLARRAVDELLRISEDELADRPELLLLRKRVLRSALAFYQEFLSERPADALAHTELLGTTERVQQILVDLESLRAVTHLYLLYQPAVIEELALTTEQQPRIHELIARAGREWLESFRDIGLKSPSERSRRTLQQARANEAGLHAILTPQQQRRLRQLVLQSEGASAFRDHEVAAALGLSPAQRERIRTIEDEAVYGWMAGPRRRPADGMDNAGESSPDSLQEQIAEILTPEQLDTWRALTGAPLPHLNAPFLGWSDIPPARPEGEQASSIPNP